MIGDIFIVVDADARVRMIVDGLVGLDTAAWARMIDIVVVLDADARVCLEVAA